MTIENVATENPVCSELRREIGERLSPFAENRIDPQSYQVKRIGQFLAALQASRRSVSDLQAVVGEIKSVVGGCGSSPFPASEGTTCLGRLSNEERGNLEGYLEQRVADIKRDFPELLEQFSEVFS